MEEKRQASFRIAVASLVLTAGLSVVGWYDYTSTRNELLTLLVDQAASMRQAVAAAASLGEAASAQTQSAMAARLLDNGRLLRMLDASGGLTQVQLDEVARANRLFRVTVLSATGERELSSGSGGPPPGAGRGFGAGAGGGPGAGGGFGPGAGAGGGFGRGPGGGRGGRGAGAEPGPGSPETMSGLAERLLAGGEAEAVSEVHGSRWDRGWRLSAGVRRVKGGAILLNVDAGEIAELSRRASIDHLLQDIAARAPEIAYVVLEDGTNRIAYGPLADAAALAPAPAGTTFRSVPIPRALEGLAAGEVEVGSTPVLEFTGRVDTARDDSPTLRLGLNLDGLRRAERRTLTRLTLSLAAALALGIVMIAFVVLRQQFGVLSEKHARAEEALRRRDRLAAMGELASTVAHEVRNPLNAIGMTAQRLRREFLNGDRAAPDESELRELLDVLGGETQRINRIVQQFLDYARPPRLSLRQASLRGMLEAAAEALRARAATRRITIDRDLSGAGDAVFDPDQLKQAVDNLLRNAIDASPDGGRVRLEARRDGPDHVIEVVDEGPGIPADILPKIFDLYFTTKADGTGVGLAVTHQIIEAHQGRIDVESAPGAGTRMALRIPAEQGASDRG
ncbi:MAG: ATP-binding protein [Vicinamibacterales bacterium]